MAGGGRTGGSLIYALFLSVITTIFLYAEVSTYTMHGKQQIGSLDVATYVRSRVSMMGLLLATCATVHYNTFMDVAWPFARKETWRGASTLVLSGVALTSTGMMVLDSATGLGGQSQASGPFKAMWLAMDIACMLLYTGAWRMLMAPGLTGRSTSTSTSTSTASSVMRLAVCAGLLPAGLWWWQLRSAPGPLVSGLLLARCCASGWTMLMASRMVSAWGGRKTWFLLVGASLLAYSNWPYLGVAGLGPWDLLHSNWHWRQACWITYYLGHLLLSHTGIMAMTTVRWPTQAEHKAAEDKAKKE